MVKPAYKAGFNMCIHTTHTHKTYTYLIHIKLRRNFLTNKSTVSASSITLGETVVMKAAGDGGSGYYEYNMGYRMSGEETWTMLQDFGTNNRVVPESVKLPKE